MTKTKKEVFDICAKHLLTQRKRSKVVNGSTCLYLNNDGLMCAVGPLLVGYPKLQDQIGDIGSILDIINSKKEYSDLKYLNEYQSMLVDLQYIHDRLPVCAWWDALSMLHNKEFNEYYNSVDSPYENISTRSEWHRKFSVDIDTGETYI